MLYIIQTTAEEEEHTSRRICGKHEHVFRCIMGSSLLSVAEQLLRDLQRTYSETKQIPDDLLIALQFVFGPCALQALDLVDQRFVTCVSSPSGRDAFQEKWTLISQTQRPKGPSRLLPATDANTNICHGMGRHE
ncbi:zinc finger SWIM domain-containing protein 7 isoform X4 [Carassius carassius]|uniref:zinc finger SWIM domain-containing protein 7 isoform X4 n=1 Tax=Carassius carassius TaxID=217509 RepID=UPI0028696591|nr:zinc finger SWIM domain-containing protein 7 isoform X4 [Carassius carassius]